MIDIYVYLEGRLSELQYRGTMGCLDDVDRHVSLRELVVFVAGVKPLYGNTFSINHYSHVLKTIVCNKLSKTNI